MMNIVRSIAGRAGYVPQADMESLRTELARAAEQIRGMRKHFRAYSAAGAGRLLGDWIMSPTTADADVRAGMIAVRTRARDLAQNNDLAKAYLRAIKKNVVGSAGFALQVKANNIVNGKLVPDKADSDYLERSFYEWMLPKTATMTGTRSFRKVQELVVETVARDGEIFVRLIRDPKVNQFGFSLQLIEPDWIDEKYNVVLPSGNIVVMGVELDSWRRPVAYHVVQRKPSITPIYSGMVVGPPYTRVPADEMIHVYDPERADQTRGVSWMAQGMVNGHQLRGYIEAAVINSRASACKMGFFRDPTGDAGEYQGEGTDTDGTTIETAEPGLLKDIGRHEFVGYDPKYPHEQFDPFVRSMIRLIASGLGVSYQTLSGDLSDTSYASGRQGLLEERETYKSAQEFIRETFLDRVYEEWLAMAILTGRLNLPFAKFSKFNSPKWTGRRWSWVDPLKDVQAAKEMRAAGFKSSTQIINEMGGDIEDTYQELEDENKMAEKHGLMLDFGSGGKGDGKTTPLDGGEGEAVPGNAPQPGNGQGGGKDGRSRLLI